MKETVVLQVNIPRKVHMTLREYCLKNATTLTNLIPQILQQWATNLTKDTLPTKASKATK